MLTLFSILFYIQLYKTTLPMFNAYGKLHTGLIRLELVPSSQPDEANNAGLLSPPKKTDRSEWQDDDPVWKVRVAHTNVDFRVSCLDAYGFSFSFKFGRRLSFWISLSAWKSPKAKV